MKPLIRSILLFLLLVLTGYGEPNSAAAGFVPARMLTPEDIASSHAVTFLASARDFQKDGHAGYAFSTIQDFFGKFSDTETAVDTKQMIAERKVHDSDDGNSE